MNIKEKIMQKLSGLFLIAMSIVSIPMENDATLAFILIPLGLWMLFSKKQIIY